MPAGALADMYDRRKIALTGLCFSSANSAILCALAWQQLLTPISYTPPFRFQSESMMPVQQPRLAILGG